MELTPVVRPLPLKIAGGIGLLVAGIYLAAAGQGSAGPTLLWVVIMAAGSLLAWIGGQFHKRAAAMAAAGVFFVLSLLLPLIPALAFLAAVVLCVIGFVDFSPDDS